MTSKALRNKYFTFLFLICFTVNYTLGIAINLNEILASYAPRHTDTLSIQLLKKSSLGLLSSSVSVNYF